MTDKPPPIDYGGPNGRSPKGEFRPNWGDEFDPEAPRGSETPVEGRCGAQNDQGRYCLKWPIRGRERCDFHGGKTPQGMATKQFKTGRWSQSLPGQLAAKYDRLVSDQEIINLSHDIALLDVRIEELQGRLATQESERSWRKARGVYDDLRAAMTEGNADVIRGSMAALGSLIRSATGVDDTWREIRESLQERRLLVESERRRLVDMHQMVTVEELLVLMTRVSSIVQQHVSDPQERRLIAREVQDLIGTGGRAAARTLRADGTVYRPPAREVQATARPVPPDSALPED